MRASLVVGLLAAAVCGASARTLWHQLDSSYTFDKYCTEFGRNYTLGGEEYGLRKQLFEGNLARIMAHNQDGSKTWKEGVNKFTDRTPDELKAYLGYNKALGYSRRGNGAIKHTLSVDAAAKLKTSLPDSVDWRLKGAVTAVKDQGVCGSCWTFASAETAESAWFLATGQLADLSEQQIASCTSNPQHCGGTGGCGGGTAEVAYASIIAAGGLASEWEYPYVSYHGTNFPCQLGNKSNPISFAANISSYVQLASNEAAPLLNALATVGPIAVTVDASAWFSYEEGVFNGCNQANPDLDHNVQSVGYGTDPTLGDYWTIRNSWSVEWGELGYIRIHRGDPANPVCGVDLKPQDGSGCDNGPPTVTVCGTCGILYDNVYPVAGK